MHEKQNIQDIMENFLDQIIKKDIEQGKYVNRRDERNNILPCVITRFPPEPNGYLHIGHAKSICLNFGLANKYTNSPGGARCHMRFDDTNPNTEEAEYVINICDTVRWLGFNWEYDGISHKYYVSDYFDKLYEYAEILIQSDKAYIDSQNNEDIRKNRGDLYLLGKDSPDRNRSRQENLNIFKKMKLGQYADGEHVLRLKIDMKHRNIMMRDPIIYRIRHAYHHRTKNQWCIYPMYDFAHCISDAIEKVTHSICTAEFENNRAVYDWILQSLKKENIFLDHYLPRQYEFARLNLTYALTSKRFISRLIKEKKIEDWDDPRLSTISGLRKKGYTPESIRLFCNRIGISKSANSLVDISVLEQSLRDDLECKTKRAFAVLDPVKLIIENFPTDYFELCSAFLHPKYPEWGKRFFHFTKEIWIDKNDFMINPDENFFRLYPPSDFRSGSFVRLLYSYVIQCTGYECDQSGKITVYAKYLPDSKKGSIGSNNYKTKGNLHWISSRTGILSEIRIYDRLFTTPQLDTSSMENLMTAFNPHSKQIKKGYIEESLKEIKRGQHIQFERHGYFFSDLVDHSQKLPVFNFSIGLKTQKNKTF